MRPVILSPSSENTIELFHIESILQDLRQGEQSVTVYFTTLTRYWQQLDLFQSYQWKCADDSAFFRQIIETKRIFKFLMGLNKTLDDVRGRILGTKPLPALREIFSEVRREESRKRVILGQSDSQPTIEASALITANDNLTDLTALASRNSSNSHPKARPWCDHCKRPGHTKETCWKIHGKPHDWKPNRSQDREARANTVTQPPLQAPTPFTKDQMDALQKMFTQVGIPSNGVGMHVSQSSSTPWIVDSGASGSHNR
ncbi:uncharacterized protein [Primulina eburnea]|uniref:uncharacterized protein n=1 Tax=Primulina eburnea TaxID=1245227 RepID=UPI003C6C22DB